jgi:hypothetical protein
MVCNFVEPQPGASQAGFGNKQGAVMNRNIWKQTALAILISATGLALAQASSPAPGSHTSNMDNSSQSSAKIISDETMPPAARSASKERVAASKTGDGAGNSGKTSGEIIREQTFPPSGAHGPYSPARAGDPSTETAGDIIKGQTSTPGSAHHPSRTTSSGTTR